MKRIATLRKAFRLGSWLALTAVGAGAMACQASQPAPEAVVAPAHRPVAPGEGAHRQVPREADAGGKYVNLLAVVNAPEDEATYGPLNDFGLWGPGEWAGATRPKGFWVYVAPDWYVWGSKDRAPTMAGDPTSVGGKYADLIKTLDVPEDQATYGAFADYGAWGPGEWAGAEQPEGFWVYVAPTWYIWRSQR